MTSKISDWKIENGSVQVTAMQRLPLSAEHPVRGCSLCEDLFCCARQMYPYKVLDSDKAGKVVYKCEYDKCEFTAPAEWSPDSSEWQALVKERRTWSAENLERLGKEFPGKHRGKKV